MRVIAGIYGSRPFAAPRGRVTRPTSDRLRETLFNVIGARIEGARFADLFAGSGAVGLEALSRGAAHVLFVESDPAAVATIRRNLESIGIRSGFDLESRPLPAALRLRERRSLDIAFLDPPYQATHAYHGVLAGLEQAGLLELGGIAIAEHERQRRHGKHPQPADFPSDQYGCLRRFRILEQGDAALSFYQIAERPESLNPL